MSYSIKVTNNEPITTTQAPQSMLDLFRRYTQAEYGQPYDPFTHQAEVFTFVGNQNQAVMLVAGTAAGKTLAIGIPLFQKLQTGQIKRILLMYPTIALMNDQRRVMDKLAELTNLQVGHIQGGMERSALVAALNKPVIVATPDAIYWFFQKNVKYAGLLIYGLALIDEFVLDEAHLFNGLTLRNLLHLKQRIMTLAGELGRKPRWHVLTATPTRELKELASQAKEVRGRSKCGEVQVTFLPPVNVVEPQKRHDTLTQAVNEALQSGARKTLLVLNSAAGAHRLFEQVRDKQPILSTDLQLRFGTVLWGELRRWLAAEQIAEEIISTVAAWVESEGPLYLDDLKENNSASISSEALMAKTGQFLQQIGRRIKDAAYAAGREANGDDFIRQTDSQLNQQGKAVQALWQMIRADLTAEADPVMVKEALNKRLTSLSDSLSRVWSDEKLTVTAPQFSELRDSLKAAALPIALVDTLTRRLQYSIELDEETTRPLRKSQAALDKRAISLRWLGESWLVKDAGLRQKLRERLGSALPSGQLQVETRHIATWGETGIPAVIYTGQMSRRDREGLIETFDQMERSILVSTPAVEVGVDFKAEMMITEECDGNGFLQRFGRVGRMGQREASPLGDGLAQVIILLRTGETWGRLLQRAQTRMSREDFSKMVIDPEAPADPERSLFPDRTYAAGSVYLDATHWLINQQVGRIGQRLNTVMFPDPNVANLARQIEQADVPFAYGLRGTLPQVSLLGSGGGSPFYILSKVHDNDLAPSPSPFEAAQAQIGYTRFLYLKNRWHIQVDWPRTLSASRAMFYWLDGRWQMVTGYGVARDYLSSFSIMRQLGNNPTVVRQRLGNVQNPRIQAILRLGDALDLHRTSHANLILGQGDVFLQRVERESGVSTLIVDRLDNPLVLPNQVWLYFLGEANKIRKQLQIVNLDNLDEVHYPQSEEKDLILLDEVAGGCFYVYERLVQHAG
jgi:superfamily II DNA/RNA helicase